MDKDIRRGAPLYRVWVGKGRSAFKLVLVYTWASGEGGSGEGKPSVVIFALA